MHVPPNSIFNNRIASHNNPRLYYEQFTHNYSLVSHIHNVTATASPNIVGTANSPLNT